MHKFIKYGLILLVVIPIAGGVGVLGYSYSKAATQPYGKGDMTGIETPDFNQVSFPFKHEYDKEKSLPFLGSAIIDIDGDGTPEVFIGGGRLQADAILEFDGTGFRDATATKGKGLIKSMPDASYGTAVIDADNDGRVDLFVARDNGITLYLNKAGGFQAQKLDIPFNPKSSPLSITLADLNNDGWVDIFASSYLRLEHVQGLTNFSAGYGAESLLLMNNGDNTFRDVTKAAGVQFTHNTFTAVFSDVDRDQDQDLIVAYDTGRVRTYKNNGDGTFTNATNPGSEWCGYPMGIAVGDYDNNGHIDFFFSNVGDTPPGSVARGALPPGVYHSELMLFSNNGGFNFEDTAPAVKAANYEFSWGTVLDDLNNDGREDIIIAQNYIDLPFQKFFKLPGRVLMQSPNNTFETAEKQMGLTNHHYEITPLLADFNNDGYRDMIRINLAGKSFAFISEGGKNGYVKLRLPETVASLGALVDVTLPDGTTLTQQMTSGEGLSSDQSHEMIFGLGQAAKITTLKVTYADGRTTTRSDIASGETIVIE